MSVRTIRHYHQIGLLAEPARDASGYRRYDSHDLIRLVRLRTLAAAGVPLSRAGELLDAEADDFTAAVHQVDVELRARIRQLQHHRRQLGDLKSGERLVLSDDVCDVLDQMRGLGLSSAVVDLQRDGCVLLEALNPGTNHHWVQWQRQALADPEYIELFRGMDELFDADPDDPQLRAYAGQAVAYALRDADSWNAAEHPWETDQAAFSLVSNHGMDISPAWRRINELVEEILADKGYRPT